MKRPTHLYSPIALMVRIYHDRYHLNYVHAKKLFVFDILLLLGTLLLMVCTVAWKTYDPTITDFVQLNISAYSEDGTPLSRISSGEPVTYYIAYKNTSDVVMERPQLHVTLPQFFEVTDIHTSNIAYDAASSIFSLPDLRPDQAGSIEIDGVYFGTPDTYEDIMVSLSYMQSGRNKSEVRHARIISSLRDAVLVAKLTGPETIRSVGSYPITLMLENTGELALTDIVLSTTTPHGNIVWDTASPIAVIEANTSTTIQGTFTTNIRDTSIDTISLSITPALLRAGSVVPQDIVELQMNVVHPSIRINTATLPTEPLQGGDVLTLSMSITNTGDSILNTVALALPLNGNTIDIARSRTLTTGATVTGNELLLQIASSLAPLESTSIDIPLAIRPTPQGGTDITMTLSPRITAVAPGSDIPLQTNITTNPVAIGTSLSVQAESRYYTNEGDQLGRGPLPPTVGQETKYWAFVTIQNTTSQVTNLTVTGKLGPGTSWTARTSVSAGNNITYSQTNNTWQYQLPNLVPYQTVGLYMELATTPTESMKGSVPILLQDISVSGQDNFIDVTLTKSISRVTANLQNDTRGTARGVVVQ